MGEKQNRPFQLSFNGWLRKAAGPKYLDRGHYPLACGGKLSLSCWQTYCLSPGQRLTPLCPRVSIPSVTQISTSREGA